MMTGTVMTEISTAIPSITPTMMSIRKPKAIKKGTESYTCTIVMKVQYASNSSTINPSNYIKAFLRQIYANVEPSRWVLLQVQVWLQYTQ